MTLSTRERRELQRQAGANALLRIGWRVCSPGTQAKVLGKTAPRHTSAEFVAFLTDHVVNQPHGKQIYVLADNLSAHKTTWVVCQSRGELHSKLVNP